MGLRNNIKVYFLNRKWRAMNPHNETSVGTNVPLSLLSVGRYTYGKLNVRSYHSSNEGLKIGSYCSIARDVNFILGGGHDYHNIMTFPLKNKLSQGKYLEATSKGPITIDDDVWIGYGAMILSGVHIGQGAVIGAGSVVAKDIPPYAIYAGGKIVRYRFPEEIINELLKIDFSKLTLEDVRNHLDVFYRPVDESVVRELGSFIK